MLRPLTDEAAAKVALNLLGATGLPAEVVARIVEAAEGNPLYVEQMLSMLVDSGALRQEHGRWVRAESYGEIAIPPTIKALIEGRLGQLRREERATIEPASVIGLEFAAPAVASLAPEPFRPAIEGHLLALTSKQLVHSVASMDSDSLYRFHHHLVRDTVYGGLLKRTRATLHVDFVRWADQVNAERGRGLEFEAILGYHLEQAHRYLGELGPLDEKGREIGADAPRRLASAGAARLRARRRQRGREPASARRRAAREGRSAAPAAAARTWRGAGGARRVQGARTRGRRGARDRAEAPATQRRRVGRLARMLVRMYSGEAGSWSDGALELTTDLIPLLEQQDAHGELARAWRLVAMAQQIAGQLPRPAKRSLKSSTTPASPATSAWSHAARSAGLQRPLRPHPGGPGDRPMRASSPATCRSPGAEPHHVQARAAARDER